jgi:hypothetical protein
MNFLIKIFEICIVAIFKKIFDKFEFSSKFTRYLIKIIAWVASVCVTALVVIVIVFLTLNTYKGIAYNSAENEVARKMKNMIIGCFDKYNPNPRDSSPNFMTWTRIEDNHNKGYNLQFLEVLGDIRGDGNITDILRDRLNYSVYNVQHPLDEPTVKLFDSLPELTPIGFLTNHIETIAKDHEMTIIVPKSVLHYIEEKIGVKTYDYDGNYVYFKYNPEFFTETIIQNLGLQKNTGYQDTKLSIIWMVVTKNNSNIIYGLSWSFTDEDKCKFPNGSIAKTQALTEVARYAKQEAREKLFFNLF